MYLSIIIPVYNAQGYIVETIQSILNQGIENFELLLIDDGSTDNSRELIKPYINNNIRYFFQENSGGPAAPRNFGIRQSAGDVIILFDSDDIMLPMKLSKTDEIFSNNPDIFFLFNNFASINEKGQVLNDSFLSQYTGLSGIVQKNPFSEYHLIESKLAYLQLSRSNFIGTSGVSFRREVVEKLGYFDEDLKNGDDRDMWFRIARSYDLVYMPEVLHYYRIREGSISSRATTQNCLNRIAVLKRQFSLPLDSESKLNLKKNLAKNYFSSAYEQFWDKNNKKQAIVYTLKGLRYKVTPPLIKLFLVIILGRSFSSFLKNFFKFNILKGR